MKILLCAAALGLFAANAALADVTTVSQIDITGGPADSGPATQTVTTYYRGSDLRIEVGGGPVTIYNAEDGNVYTVDPAAKTYWMQSEKDVRDGLGKPSGPMADRVSADSKLDVNKVKSSVVDTSKSISGYHADDYTLSGWFKLSPKSEGGGFGRGGGGFPGGGGGFPGGGGGGFPGGGGGFPGGGHRRGGGGGDDGDGPGGGQGPRGAQFPTTEVDGDLWASGTLGLPGGKKADLTPLMVLEAKFAGAAARDLSDKIVKNKQIPLGLHITTTARDPRTSDVVTTVETTEVKSISSDPIPDALFHIPSDYTKVDPPIRTSDFDPIGKPAGGDDGPPPMP